MKDTKQIKQNKISIFYFFLLCAAVSALSVSIMQDFHFSLSIFLKFIVVWAIMFVFIFFITAFINLKDNLLNWHNENKTIISNSIILITITIYIIMLRYIDLFSIPFMLPALLFLTVSNKQTAMLMNLFITILFVIVYSLSITIVDVNIFVSEIIMLLLYAVGSMVLIAVLDINKSRLHVLKVSIVVGGTQFLLGFLSMLYTMGAVDSFLNTVWILVGSAVSIALYMTAMPLLESVFKLYTNTRLSEYCSFDNKLLKQLAEEAPGTFNHCLVVGNLSEACAASIGENTLLARVCAYYHDVGKIVSPSYFGENNTDNYNPHDELIPEVSVSILTKHTQYGYDLILKEGMPQIIADVALQHHGNSLVQYFYNKAQNLMESTLSKDNYCYKNPKPQTKIAAIVMITDTIEAASRANYTRMDYNAICELIARLIKQKLDDGQLSECDITMSELGTIEKTIIEVLPGIYHKRISYANQR